MATTGLKNFHYAIVTADTASDYTTSVPKRIPGGISVTATTTTNTSTLYADDGAAATDTAIGSTQVTINTKDLPTEIEAELLGHTVSADGVLIEKTDSVAPYVAVGFSGATSDGGEMFVWLFKGRFAIPDQNLQTRGENVEYQTPTIVGQFIKRTHDNAFRAKVVSTDEGVNPIVIEDWFKSVNGAMLMS